MYVCVYLQYVYVESAYVITYWYMLVPVLVKVSYTPHREPGEFPRTLDLLSHPSLWT